jgi:ATP-dependent helicase/nuclease subunit B
MAEGGGPKIFTIPPHRAFADALAAGLIAQSKGDRLALARTTILLPNNRAQRTLTDAFVRRAEGGGLLLPRMVPIGDPELDDRLGTALDPAGDDEPVPPAIEPVERQLILARLVQRARVRVGDPIDAAEAMRLAADLARVIDQLLVEEVRPSRLKEAVAPELAEHWQSSLTILETVLEDWPRELAVRGLIDLADRRNRLIDRAAERWRKEGSANPIVAAGITTAAPAAARLLRSISLLDNGMVVFPGIDCDMPAAEWNALGPHDAESGKRDIETHPQYQLKLLLDRIGVARGEVKPWRWGGGRNSHAARGRAVANAMAPAEFTHKWQSLANSERRLSGVRAAVFATPGEEAQGIALALRELVETPERTAALVTPDRALAQRVVAHLKRWGIEADDSAGQQLSTSAPGTLLIGLAEAIAENFAPVPLLALLKHPLVHAGEGRVAWLEGVRRLDRALRGPRPPAGLNGIEAFLGGGEGRDRKVREEARAFWQEARMVLEPDHAGEGLGALLAALREGATVLAGDAVWAGPAGRQAAELIASLEASAASGPELARIEVLPRLLRDMFDGVAVRPPQGGHPRIFIRGLIEARLGQEDLVILGGLNEGVWPGVPAPDPWLAPSIRRALGLPGLERRIGLAGHDFASALGAQQVLITRARRDDRAPMIASRFLLRLEAMTGGVTREPRLARWTKAIDAPSAPPAYAARPAPVPPVADRPDEIAVTKLDRLKADPFAFYADAMLKLSRLDMVDADPTPAWRGTMLHAVFEAWMKEDGCDPAKLRDRAAAMLRDLKAHPVMKALWEPRLMEAIEWVVGQMQANAAQGQVPVAAEIFGDASVAGVKLYGKVDRIDRLADGGLAIIDYKTGKPPSRKQVEQGFALQLGLLGLIAEKDGFKDVAGVPKGFEYWSMARDKGQFGHVVSPVGGKGIPPEDFTTHAAHHLVEAVEKWLTGDAPFTAKLHPEFAPYGDYDQLMRLEEWYGRSDGGEGA